ncbi:30S ribosomal protein S2 [Conexivisphaera calida]|uniref:Small ribosomal subunit protein uS2 n=1 Tax=Conexivisphaera calida TaxID=1874277 RepID=A0A4P2VEB6_9ARCH|nr:30S ribosomal protein S2 [Conexivisphaera calida]BBE41743.1 SSU ribosomal protein Sae [Conexivisphaera calida]
MSEGPEDKEQPQQQEDQLSAKTLVATGIRIGTTVRTKFMEQFIARMRPDGLYILDMNKILYRIDVAGHFLARIEPGKLLVYSSREFAKTPIERFSELVGCRAVTGRFMPGMLTNPQLPYYVEADAVLVVDPLLDSQAVVEASRMGIPVVALCDTDCVPSDVDLIIPANNRGRKALAAVFWLLARSTLIHSGALSPEQPMKYAIEDFETKLEEQAVEG